MKQIRKASFVFQTARIKRGQNDYNVVTMTKTWPQIFQNTNLVQINKTFKFQPLKAVVSSGISG